MNPNKRLRLAKEKLNAGIAALETANYQQAVEESLAAAELFKGLTGQKRNYVTGLHNAATALSELGRCAEAQKLLEKVIPLRKKILDSQHPDTLSSLNSLANVYQAQGDYDKARELHERVLSIREQVLGLQHPNTLNSLNNLATVYQDQGNYDKARELHKRTLSIREQVLGLQHPDTLKSLNNLANVYRAQGNYDKARELHERALSIREQVLGSQHPVVAESLNNLANVYQDQGDYDKARELHERALGIYEQVLGLQHPDTLNNLNNLANVYQAQGDYDKARELHEKALSIREQVLGSQHPVVAESLNNLALIYEKQGDTAKAQSYYQRAQAIITQVFDENHPTAQKISQNYLKLQQQLEELKRREIEQRVALEEAKKLNDLSFMATNIAHNINNPVGTIRLSAQRGLRKLKTELTQETAQDIFERILRQADRLDDIIRRFRASANGNHADRENIALNPLVEQIKEDFIDQLKTHHIDLKLVLSADNPQSYANNFVITEVLMNLIRNALEALEGKKDAFIQIETWQRAEKVGFYVDDNGDGISEAQQKNLFTPFHSTKASGGLGLYFAHKALADLHGTITYQARQPNGARFVIELLPMKEN